MKKEIELAARLRGMKRGDRFTVKTKRERHLCLEAAKHLTNAGVISLRITTFSEDGHFVVAAI